MVARGVVVGLGESGDSGLTGVAGDVFACSNVGKSGEYVRGEMSVDWSWVLGEAVGVVCFVSFSFSLAFIVYKLTGGLFPLRT